MVGNHHRPIGLRQVVESGEEHGRHDGTGQRHGEAAAEQQAPASGARLSRADAAEKEEARERQRVDESLRMAAEQQRRGAQEEQQEVAAGALVVAARDAIEHRRQQRGAIDQRPPHPEQQEAPEAESEAADESRSLAEALAAQQEEAEDQRHQHAQRRRDSHRLPEREGIGRDDERLEDLRLRIGHQRHARAGARVPQRPAPLPQSAAHLQRPRRDLVDEIAVQRDRRRIGRRELAKRMKGREAAERQKDSAAEEDRGEEEDEHQAEDGQDAPGNGIEPAPQQRGETGPEENHVQTRQQVGGGPAAHPASSISPIRFLNRNHALRIFQKRLASMAAMRALSAAASKAARARSSANIASAWRSSPPRRADSLRQETSCAASSEPAQRGWPTPRPSTTRSSRTAEERELPDGTWQQQSHPEPR